MKSWTNRSWLARRLCAASLVLLAAAMPAHAFQKTALADGGFEYFFAAPSLDIRSAGDLDLTGLSFIEGVTGGFRVGASFDLDWVGGENASLASSASTWSGLDTQPRSLSIVAGGDILIGTTHLSLSGGTIFLAAGGSLDIGDGSAIDVGGSGVVALLEGPNIVFPREPIVVIVPSPIPEPAGAALMLAGLLALAGVAARRAKAEG